MACVFSTRATVLTNGGFETGSLAGWTSFGNTIPNVLVEGNETTPHSGNYYLKTFGQFTGAINDSGVYQDNVSQPGTVYSANGWLFNLGTDAIHGEDSVWLEVSFRDSLGNALALYRSAVVTGSNLASFGGVNTWFNLQITNECSFNNAPALILEPGTVTNTVSALEAPAGTATVRYQVVFEQGSDNANGSMYFDDLSLNVTGHVALTNAAAQQWNIVWDDEFNSNSINTKIWGFETGNNSGWGNNELEYYTGRTNNAYEAGGLLHIVAQKESMNGFNYTSARMKTLGMYATPTYGRFEWRARLPSGTGMWPALWMMGTNYPVVGWPSCGEIDVVENDGSTPDFVQGSLHANGFNPTAIDYLPSGESTTNFHTYDLDWQSNSISWYVDGQWYETQTTGAPFNAPFFFLLNVAVGGSYVGQPTTNAINSGTSFPQEMQVDYVRVYEPTAPLQLSISSSNGRPSFSWPSAIVCHLQACTNSLANGSWVDLPATPNPYTPPASGGPQAMFYRLASP